MAAGDGLVLDKVSIRLSGRELVAVDTTVAPGEVLTVMGPSGSGKSTLLSHIAGLLDPAFAATGRVRLGAHDLTDLPTERRRIGILFQDPLLFPHLSVAGNLLFGIPNAATDRRARADAALAEAGLDGFGPRDPDTLSGGQKARVALMRVLVSEPRAVLLDEPFSKLDADRRAEFRALVFGRVRNRGLPCILVTHDAADAAATGGRVVGI